MAFFPLYLSGLERLSLEGCSVSNLGIFNLFSCADRGDSLHFGKESKLPVPLQESFPRLKFLNVSDCVLIDDKGIQEISEKVYELKELEIRGLNRITLRGLNTSLARFQQLEKLDLRGILNLRGKLIVSGLVELKISIQVLEILSDLKDLQKLEIFISGRDTRGFGDILGKVIINNQNLQDLVIVKDNSLGMYSLEDLDMDFNPDNFPHLKITLATDQGTRFT